MNESEILKIVQTVIAQTLAGRLNVRAEDIQLDMSFSGSVLNMGSATFGQFVSNIERVFGLMSIERQFLLNMSRPLVT